MKTSSISLDSPLEPEQARSLRVGDVVSLTGTVYTMRDQASVRILRLIEAGEEVPVPRGATIFHAGPAVDWSDGEPRIVSIGPTTSARMNGIAASLIRELDVRCIVGKGGMDRSVLASMKQVGCVYALAIGGCAAIYTSSITRVSQVIWKEMGPEAIFELQVEGFGPLIVTMDSHGRSLHAEIEERAARRIYELFESGTPGRSEDEPG